MSLRKTLVCSFVMLMAGPAMAGTPDDGGDRSVPEQILSFYAPFVFPKVFQDVTLLRSYIRQEEFMAYRSARGDLMALDLIFHTALEITEGNRPEALLITTFSVMDHRRVGVRLPVVGPLLWFPLTSEFQDEFDSRIRNLPSRLYPDTPAQPTGDRDKLQHFFGSAFLAFMTESRGSSERVGTMIEYGEAEFIVGGRYDERDRRANQHGRSFGLALMVDGSVAPSDFLQLFTAASSGGRPGSCDPGEEKSGWEER